MDNYFCGIDPGIVATGITVLPNSHVVAPNSKLLTSVRIDEITSFVSKTVPNESVVVIEEPMGKLGHSRSNIHLFAAIRQCLLKKMCLVFAVAPTSVKKFATEYGKSSKGEMESAAGLDTLIIKGDEYRKGSAEWAKYSEHAVDSWWMAHIGRVIEYPEEYSEVQLDAAYSAKII